MQEADLQIIIQDFHSLPPPQSQRTKERKWYYFSSTLDREWYQLGNLIVASQLISTCKTKAEHMTCVVFQREWTCRLFLDSLRWRIKPEHIYYLWVSPKGSSWTKEDEPGFGSSVDVANPGRGLENPGSAFFLRLLERKRVKCLLDTYLPYLSDRSRVAMPSTETLCRWKQVTVPRFKWSSLQQVDDPACGDVSLR